MKLLLIIFNLLILANIIKYKKTISKKFNLILHPNKKTFHRRESYLLGGIILFIAFLLNYFYLLTYENQNYYYNFFIISCFFLISQYDDILKISPSKRIFFTGMVALFAIYFDNTLSIKTLNFYYLENYYFPESFLMNFVFPTLCIIVLVNAFNFIDGIDGLASLIGLSIIIYLLVKNFELFNYFYSIIAVLTMLIFLNLRKSVFLGDSGNYLISILICCVLLKENYYSPNLYYAEEIFLLLFVPGLDMIRLFGKRIINKKNPLLGDTGHLHHKLYFNFGKLKTLFIYVLMVNLPIYIFYFNNNFLGIVLVFLFIFYCFLIFYLSKKNNMGTKLKKL